MAAFRPKYLQPNEVDTICAQYLRDIEAVALRENLQQIAQQICGGQMLSSEHAEPVIQALEMERFRLAKLLTEG